MTTTDANGIVLYETTDPISPLQTLLNAGQTSVSNALNNGAGARPKIVTQGTRPSSPFDGQMIKENDTRRTLIYDGTTANWTYMSGPLTVLTADTGFSAANIAIGATGQVVLGPSNLTTVARGPVTMTFEFNLIGLSGTANWAATIIPLFEDTVGSGAYSAKKGRRITNFSSTTAVGANVTVFIQDVSPGLHRWQLAVTNDPGSAAALTCSGAGSWTMTYAG
jgi:hypothetical protein